MFDKQSIRGHVHISLCHRHCRRYARMQFLVLITYQIYKFIGNILAFVCTNRSSETGALAKPVSSLSKHSAQDQLLRFQP